MGGNAFVRYYSGNFVEYVLWSEFLHAIEVPERADSLEAWAAGQIEADNSGLIR